MSTVTRLSGKVAVVTGGGRGIGRGIALALGNEGAHVVVCSRSEGELRKVEEEIRGHGGSASAMKADMRSDQDVAALATAVLKRYDRVDILVNNAGLGYLKPVNDLTIEEFDEMWKVNVRGVFLVTKAFLPSMMKAGSGAIVNIASLAGKNSFKGGAGYGATKWALRGFAGSLMLEVRDYNIRVVTIFPGSVETSFSRSGKKGENIPRPEDVASAVIFAVTAEQRAMFSEIDLRPTRP